MKSLFSENRVIPTGRNSRGNTLVEYVLLALLICMVSVAALMSFGNAFSAKVTGFKASMKSQTQKAANAQAQNSANHLAVSGSPLGGSGGAFNSSSYASIDNQAQTTGANGNTLTQASTGSVNIGTAGTVANLSPEQAEIVKDVANTAHKVAALQQLLTDLSNYSNGDIEKFRNSTVVFEGQTMTALQIAKALGKYGLVAQLDTKKNNLLASTTDPAVVSVVAGLTDQVKQNATATSQAAKTAVMTATDPTSVSQVTDATQTDTQASQICDAGKGKDTSKKCE